jgi:hypothetical protein
MDAIEQAAKDAAHLSHDDPANPMVPANTIISARDPAGLQMLGITMVGDQRKVVID